MKSFDKDLKKYSEKISLKVSERRELHERILSYMEYHPLPKQMRATEDLAGAISSESFITIHFTKLHARIAGGVLVIILIFAPFVAERSVPGDVLYLVKTGFNESIQKNLATTPFEKIEFETKLMERRISEARELADEGKLTEQVKSQIAQTVKEHTTAVRASLTELRTQDADEAAIAEIAFNSSLQVQSAVLGANKSTSSVDSIITAVDEALEGVVVSNAENVKPSFEGLRARIEIQTTRAYELFETVKITATEEEISDIERRFSDINRLILEAEEKRSNGDETASESLASTLGVIQKFISFMTSIDVRTTVSLESLVPVVLSDEERIDSVKAKLQKLNEKMVEVVSRLEITEGVTLEPEIRTKVQGGLTHVGGLIPVVEGALERGDIIEAEKSMNEAETFIADLDTLTQSVVVPPVMHEEPILILPEVEEGRATTTSATTTPATSTVSVATSTPINTL